MGTPQIPSVDSDTKQFPDAVRQRIATNLKSPGSVEGDAIGSRIAPLAPSNSPALTGTPSINGKAIGADSLFAGSIIVADRGNSFTGGNSSFSNGTDTQAYARTMHRFTYAAASIRLVFNNYTQDAPNSNPITVSAVVAPGVAAATASDSRTVPVTFGGSASVTIPGGGTVVSDVIPLTFSAGQIMYARTSVSATSGGKWPTGMITQTGLSEGLVSGTTVTPGYLATSSPTNIPASYTRVYSPALILGKPSPVLGKPAAAPMVLGVGDSIMAGVGDPYDDRGFFRVACRKAGVAFSDLGSPGATADVYLKQFWVKGAIMTAPFDYVVTELGSNDCSALLPFATIQSNMIAWWLNVAAHGHRIVQTTITPRSNSTDNWQTTDNQTALSGYADLRNQLNAWIRAGAPLTASFNAAAIGQGAYVIGQPGHPLTDWFELADIVENGRDTNVWKPPQGRSLQVSGTAGGSSLDTSSTVFTAADTGETLFVVGAGSSDNSKSAIFNITGNSNGGTRASVQGIVLGSVSNATANIGHMTIDGIHPSPTAHRMIADALAVKLSTMV